MLERDSHIRFQQHLVAAMRHRGQNTYVIYDPLTKKALTVGALYDLHALHLLVLDERKYFETL